MANLFQYNFYLDSDFIFNSSKALCTVGKMLKFLLTNYNFPYISNVSVKPSISAPYKQLVKSEYHQQCWQWATRQPLLHPVLRQDINQPIRGGTGQTISHVHNFGTQNDLFHLILKLYTRYNLKECILLYSTQDKCRKK